LLARQSRILGLAGRQTKTQIKMENKPVSENQASFSPDQEWDEEELEAAGMGSRLINYLFDLLGIMLLTFLIGTLLGLLGLDALLVEENSLLMGFLIVLAYYTLLEGFTGRTLGKFITGTYVVTDEGLKPSFPTILGRTLCRFIPFEAFTFLFSSIGFHDRLSHTRVVKDQPKEMSDGF
jgi:uncharacterized RDD family membrane protein YckC